MIEQIFEVKVIVRTLSNETITVTDVHEKAERIANTATLALPSDSIKLTIAKVTVDQVYIQQHQ